MKIRGIKGLRVLVLVALFGSALVMEGRESLLIVEGDEVLRQEGDCALRYAPCSTFKVALSVMGYDAGILVDERNPEWRYKEEYVNWLSKWEQAHDPELWLRNSCVWYSQVLTKKMGMKAFQAYVDAFEYGNCDVSGDIGKDNGLEAAWLSSSLEISVEEQVGFLKKLVKRELPVSDRAHEMTKKILYVEELVDGWKLYGKTGNGYLLSEDRIRKLDRQVGWFIGWIEKGERVIIFAELIVDEAKQVMYASQRAKAAVKKKVKEFIFEKDFFEKKPINIRL